MEPADIDWKRLEWRFAKDDLYEHFDAPKWIDLSSASLSSVSSSGVPDDEAWFCRPDCSHPKTAEDFLSLRPSTPGGHRKIGKASISPLGERKLNKNSILRDTNLKKRGAPLPFAGESPNPKPAAKMRKSREDLENQNPNLCQATPERAIAKNPLKETIKSSAERREPPPERNLFPKKEILTQISEFCNEIKKLAMPRKDHNCDKVDDQKDANSCRDRMNKPGLPQEIRSCPPTPQRIASSPLSAAANSTAPIQGILKEMVANDAEDGMEKKMKSPASLESKTLDLFWFLKPCVSYL